MNNPVSTEVYSEKEAAALLGVSLSTMRRWRRSQTGPTYFRFGDILRYTKTALEEFREKHTERAA